MLECILDEDIYQNNIEYFFYIFPAHFSPLGDLWKKELKSKFKKNFEPIYVVSTPNTFTNKRNNVIILNKQDGKNFSYIKNIYKELSNIDLNKQFSKEKAIKEIIQKLSKKQKRILIIPYTTSFLSVKYPHVNVVGPDPQIATCFDNKIQAYDIFKKLNIKSPEYRLYKNINSLKNDDIKYPVFISGSYSSGSNQGKILRNKSDLEIFCKSLSKINVKNAIAVIKYINKQKSVETSAYISKRNGTSILNTMDEISNGTICVGNIYPTSINNNQIALVREMTLKIGNYMSRFGYRGAFGCGFIIDENDEIYLSDLNPRKQGFFLGDLLFADISPIHLDISTFIDNNIQLLSSIKKTKGKAWIYYQVLNNNPFIIRNDFSQRLNFDYNRFFNKKNNLNCYIFWPSNKTIYSNRMAYFFGFGKNSSKLIKDALSLESYLKREYLSKTDIFYFGIKSFFVRNVILRTTLYPVYYLFVYLRHKYQDIVRKWQPIFYIFRESIESIYVNPYRSGIAKQIAKELFHIRKYKKNNVLFIGGGSVPYSALLLKKIYKSRVSILDSNWLPFYFGRRLLLRLKVKGVNYIHNSGQKYGNYADYDLIYFASQTTSKLQALENIFKQSKKSQTVVIRKSRYYDKKFGLNDEKMLRIVLKYQAKIEHVRHDMHDLLIIKK